MRKYALLAILLYVFYTVLLKLVSFEKGFLIMVKLRSLVIKAFKLNDVQLEKYLRAYNRLRKWGWNKCLTLCLVASTCRADKAVIVIGAKKDEEQKWVFHSWLKDWEWPGPIDSYKQFRVWEV